MTTELKVIPKRCQYCGEPAECVSGSAVYPHLPKLHKKWFWVCKPCDARVGCHPGTMQPLGKLAGPALRSLRMNAHNAFDRLWKSGEMSRGSAYRWLQKVLDLPPAAAHIGEFDESECKRLIAAVRNRV